MGRKREVVVKGGGANLYEVSESGGEFWVYHVRVKLLSNDRQSIGRTRGLDDALSLIRSHSGREIDRVG